MVTLNVKCVRLLSHEFGRNSFISDLDVHRCSETMEPFKPKLWYRTFVEQSRFGLV